MSSERVLHVLSMLRTFYGVMGNPPDLKGAVALIAETLAARAEPQAINEALNRCMLECRFPVRLPDILLRIPGTEASDVHAEKRIAWDTVERFVKRYVGNDIYGNYGPEFGWFGPKRNWEGEIVKAASYPELSDRILDSVRRSGGWKVYACMTNEDFPHQQKRFFEEYEAWTAVERIGDRSRLLEMPNLKELVAAKAMSEKRPEQKLPAPASPTGPMSPQKARIMKLIKEAGRRDNPRGVASSPVEGRPGI